MTLGSEFIEYIFPLYETVSVILYLLKSMYSFFLSV